MAIRSLVSKKKIRFQEDGFDLDLTYINGTNTEYENRIIAMGFPSEGAEAAYRNPMSEVQRFFTKRHKGKGRIYNLCSERAYEHSKFENIAQCTRFPFDDHNPAPLSVIKACCEDMYDWLSRDKDNVVAVHCKAGKGRTGMIISAFLVYAGIASDTMEALQIFGSGRTTNSKGVTIPSQMRYVHYYEQCLRHGFHSFPVHTYRLRHIRLITVPNFDVGGGCDPYVDIRLCVFDEKKGCHVMKKIFDFLKANKKVKNYQPRDKYADIDLEKFDVRVRGDVKIVLFDWDKFGSPDKMAHFWFNTGFISNNYLLFHKDVIDRACKDKANKEFDPDFKVEIFLDKLEGDEAEATIEGDIVTDDRDDEEGEDEDAEGVSA